MWEVVRMIIDDRVGLWIERVLTTIPFVALNTTTTSPVVNLTKAGRCVMALAFPDNTGLGIISVTPRDQLLASILNNYGGEVSGAASRGLQTLGVPAPVPVTILLWMRK